MTRRRSLLPLALAALLAPPAALAQTPPAVPFKAMKIVVPSAPGGSNDVFARALSDRLAKRLGVPVIVDNKPGAAGVVAGQAVLAGEPNGGTVLFTSVSFSTSAAVQQKMPYDSMKAFAPVALLNRGPMLLVTGNQTALRTVPDVVTALRDQKASLNFASGGNGSIGHMSGELLNSMAGGKAVHVPYKGSAQAATDMMGGNIQLFVTTAASVSAPLQANAIRPVAVTSLERSRFMPNLPTVAETLPGYDVESWWGVFAPAGTPRATVEHLNREIRQIATQPDMRELFARESTVPGDLDSDAFAAYVQKEFAKWRKLAAARNIAMD